MNKKVFVGFGFGPIQAGLFVAEAFASGNFSRLVVAEIDLALVAAVRANKGRYSVNVAGPASIQVQQISGVEIYNPNAEQDRAPLLAALAEASEISTSLPAVSYYDAGQHSVAALIAEGIRQSKAPAVVVYAAENNNHAAEILQEKVEAHLAAPLPPNVQFLNTVIGKMSQVVIGAEAVAAMHLAPMTPGFDRAFLVEAFNRILISRIRLDNFTRRIEVFIEKDDLLPFEEAKLYGHNAIHALLAYLGAAKGYTKMTELKHDAAIMRIARDAFLNESGTALIKKYAHLSDPLFTEAGYHAYAEDLLERMTNPHLADTIARAGRDPRRKLAYHDRIFGTMDLAASQGIRPKNMALAALAGLAALLKQDQIPGIPRHTSPADLTDADISGILRYLWAHEVTTRGVDIITCLHEARKAFRGVAVMPPAARLHILLASEADYAVIIRRGPSKRVCTIGWDRTNDTFTVGQWLKGRIYERRSDLSPDGKHMIYFAMNGKWHSETGGSWTAISRAPYLKAVGLWAKGDCWHGGGLFLTNSTFWINHGYGHRVLTSPLMLHEVDEPPFDPCYGGECPGVYFIRLQRDGWQLQSMEASESRSVHTFEKRVSATWILRKHAVATCDHAEGRGCYYGSA